MSQVVGDPDELERFAAALTQFLDHIEEARGGLDSAFGHVSESWQDSKQAQFEDEYRALGSQLASFEASARDLVPYLDGLASRLREYLGS